MKHQIKLFLLNILYYRFDLIEIIKPFLSQLDSSLISYFQKDSNFISFLTKNEIIKDTAILKQMPHGTFSTITNDLQTIIKQDDISSLQQKNFDGYKGFDQTLFINNFYGNNEKIIPILHYCIITKSIQCFKFLLLNGANPLIPICSIKSSTSVDNSYISYEWDCISISVGLGEWEFMKLLEEGGIQKQYNSKVWEAASLTYRNKLIKYLLSNANPNEQEFKNCFLKGIFAAVTSNNFQSFELLLKFGDNINVIDFFIQKIQFNQFS